MEEIIIGLDTLWVLLGAALVFFMQPGFAMVETGFTRAKNAGNIIMKNLMDFCIGTVMFVFLGFSLMMSEDYLFGFIGIPNLNIFSDFNGFIQGNASSFVFNLVFCATAATIVSGAMAERYEICFLLHLFRCDFPVRLPRGGRMGVEFQRMACADGLS